MYSGITDKFLKTRRCPLFRGFTAIVIKQQDVKFYKNAYKFSMPF